MSGKIKRIEEQRDKQWERLDSIISRSFSSSNMSNSKWVKLFKLCCPFSESVKTIKYKLVYSDEIYTTNLESYEEHIEHQWFREPLIYKELEWVEFPFSGNSNIDKLVTALNTAAKFPLTETGTGIRVNGYQKV